MPDTRASEATGIDIVERSAAERRVSDRKADRGRHQARKRAVDLLFEAEARGMTAAEVADATKRRWRRTNPVTSRR